MNHEHPCTITAVSEIQKLVLGSAPTVALASQELNLVFAYSPAALNAVHSQQQSWIVAQTATATDVSRLNSR